MFLCSNDDKHKKIDRSATKVCQNCGAFLCGECPNYHEYKCGHKTIGVCHICHQQSIDPYSDVNGIETLCKQLAKQRVFYLVKKRGVDLSNKEREEIKVWNKMKIDSEDSDEDSDKDSDKDSDIETSTFCDGCYSRGADFPKLAKIEQFYTPQQLSSNNISNRCKRHKNFKRPTETILTNWIDKLENFLPDEAFDDDEEGFLSDDLLKKCGPCILQFFKQMWLDNSGVVDMLQQSRLEPLDILVEWKEVERPSHKKKRKRESTKNE
jgi:hypothetical protein